MILVPVEGRRNRLPAIAPPIATGSCDYGVIGSARWLSRIGFGAPVRIVWV